MRRTSFTSDYGKRVRAARVAAGLSQEDLAQRVGLTRSSIANIEAGRQAPMAEQVVDTALALTCDPRWLLTGWEQDHPSPVAAYPVKLVAAHVAALRQLANQLDEAKPSNGKDGA